MVPEKSEDQNQICGNGRIDEGEECDAGFLSKFNLDDCCDKSCRLVAGAVCRLVCLIALGGICST